MKWMRLVSCCALLGLVACSKPEAETEVAGTVQVQVEQLALRPITDAVIAYGSVDADVGEFCAIAVEVESQLAAVLVRAGESVHRGQPVLRVLPSPATSLELGNAQREARSAQVEWQRVASLRERQLATESELQATRTAAESTAALRDSLQARAVPGSGLLLKSPCEAVVDELAYKVGEWMPSGSVAARLVPATGSMVRLGLEPESLSGLKAGALARLFDLAGHEQGEGRVLAIDRRVDSHTGLATVLVRAQHGTALAVGLRLRAEMIRGVHAQALSVPAAAITYEGEQPVLYVVNEGKAQKRLPQLGLQAEGRIEIVAGVTAGEQVVVLGNDVLSDGAEVQVAGAAAADEPP